MYMMYELNLITKENYLFSVVSQPYIVEVHNEHVIRGNDALMACEIPSFVSDLLGVEAWVDQHGNDHPANRVIDNGKLPLCH